MKKILEQIAVTAELMGQVISPTAAAMMASDLSAYPENLIIDALTIVRKESKGRFSLALIIEQIEKLNPDGRPGADEAWAMIPRDEYSSVVITDEMSQALGIANKLLDEGDQVAARMAFKESYTRIVDANKRAGVMPKWFPSLGSDKEGRAPALENAVRLGRIGANHAAELLAPCQAVAMLESNGKMLEIEHKPVSYEQAKSNIARLKNMLLESKLTKSNS